MFVDGGGGYIWGRSRDWEELLPRHVELDAEVGLVGGEADEEEVEGCGCCCGSLGLGLGAGSLVGGWISALLVVCERRVGDGDRLTVRASSMVCGGGRGERTGAGAGAGEETRAAICHARACLASSVLPRVTGTADGVDVSSLVLELSSSEETRSFRWYSAARWSSSSLGSRGVENCV